MSSYIARLTCCVQDVTLLTQEQVTNEVTETMLEGIKMIRRMVKVMLKVTFPGDAVMGCTWD
jgi:hypothetical protein